jgi:hypothetical protein
LRTRFGSKWPNHVKLKIWQVFLNLNSTQKMTDLGI